MVGVLTFEPISHELVGVFVLGGNCQERGAEQLCMIFPPDAVYRFIYSSSSSSSGSSSSSSSSAVFGVLNYVTLTPFSPSGPAHPERCQVSQIRKLAE